jgi:HEAT repeats
MTPLLTLTLAVLAADPPAADTPRKPSAYAPSLPQLTKEEEEKDDQIIDRFIQADVGLLRGAEARDAVRDFRALKSDAIPNLIRGLNRAARIEHSCPVVVIAEKLQRMLLASDDQELLQFARDEIGAGVGRSRHQNVLQDLRFQCMLRKNALARRGPPGPRGPRLLSNSELVQAASTERGPRLKQVLNELATRRGKEVLDGLTVAATSYDTETKKLGRDLMERHLARQPAAYVKDRLADEQAAVRLAAVRVIGTKFPALAPALIDLLGDSDAEVRAAAREALVRLSRGQDFGPSPDASTTEREQARQKWRDWWARRATR